MSVAVNRWAPLLAVVGVWIFCPIINSPKSFVWILEDATVTRSVTLILGVLIFPLKFVSEFEVKLTGAVTSIGEEDKGAMVDTFISLLKVLTPFEINVWAVNEDTLVFGKLRVVSFDVITGPDSETFNPFLKVTISLKVLVAKNILEVESFAKLVVSIALLAY